MWVKLCLHTTVTSAIRSSSFRQELLKENGLLIFCAATGHRVCLRKNFGNKRQFQTTNVGAGDDFRSNFLFVITCVCYLYLLPKTVWSLLLLTIDVQFIIVSERTRQACVYIHSQYWIVWLIIAAASSVNLRVHIRPVMHSNSSIRCSGGAGLSFTKHVSPWLQNVMVVTHAHCCDMWTKEVCLWQLIVKVFKNGSVHGVLTWQVSK